MNYDLPVSHLDIIFSTRITKVLSCILTFTFLCLSGDVIPSSDSSGRVGSVDDGHQTGGGDYGDVDDEDHLYCLSFLVTSCTFYWP